MLGIFWDDYERILLYHQSKYLIVIKMESQIEDGRHLFDEADAYPLSGIGFQEHGRQSGEFLGLAEEHKHIRSLLQFRKIKSKTICNKTVKVRKEKKVVEENPNLKKGHWSNEQNKRYHWFLQIYNQHFVNKHLRRMDKIFKTMSKFVGTREAQQCRSHHQKMEKKYHSFYKIIGSLRKHFFGTLLPTSLELELKEYQIQIFNPIVEANQIQNEDQATIIKLEDNDLNNLQVDEHSQELQGNLHSDNLLGDEYQQNLPFNFH